MEAAQLKPYLSREDEKRGLGEDLPGHAHKSEVVPPIILEIPQESGRTWEDQNPPEIITDRRAVRHSKNC